MKLTSLRRTLATTAIAVALAASACGSSDTATAPATDAVETLPVDTEPDGPELGGAESDETVPADMEPPDATAATDGVDTDAGDSLDLDVSSEPIESDTSKPASDVANEVIDPDTFIPADEDVPFCRLVAGLNRRPLPSDEYEKLTVARDQAREMRELAVPEITGDIDIILEFLVTAILANGDITIDDTSRAVDDAMSRLNDHVRERCKGTPDSE